MLCTYTVQMRLGSMMPQDNTPETMKNTKVSPVTSVVSIYFYGGRNGSIAWVYQAK